MFTVIFRLLCHIVLRLRYRIEITGYQEVVARGTHGVLFLPCHPALVDPILIVSTIHKDFVPHTIADADAVGAWGIRQLVQHLGARLMPSMAKRGVESRAAIHRVLSETANDLRCGENVLMYPSGHRMRTNREDVGANSAVETLLRAAPDTRVVLVRIRGLWGSSFSLAASQGREPNLIQLLLRGMGILIANGIFFTPRRHVTLEFVEPVDLPLRANRTEINRYLEAFYNSEPLPKNTQVPAFWWNGSLPVTLPEPNDDCVAGDINLVPLATREIVTNFLRELSGVQEIRDEAKLAHDLSMDSLSRAELLVWLEQEFGLAQGNVDSLQTVADVLLAASGDAVIKANIRLKSVPTRWFTNETSHRLYLPDGKTVTEVFLQQATARPDYPIIADQASGMKTYRDLITGILALKPQIETMSGNVIGIMLPASIAATLVYITTLFAGKTPVMLNWTMGSRNLLHTLEQTGVQNIITAQQLITRLQSQGMDLSLIEDRLTSIESMVAGIPKVMKLRAAIMARLSWTSLRRAVVSPIAAILSTSGSENLPKAVPLTHDNLLNNLRVVTNTVPFYSQDRIVGMLPPFHSFGLCDNILLALCMGLRTVFHANPTEGQLLARIIDTYQATVLIGTPTFLQGIVRSAPSSQLASLRLAVTGAEECPPRLFYALQERCPDVELLLGYGITECSPIVSYTVYDPAKPASIGYTFPSVEHVIVDVDTGDRVAAGEIGVLLLRGPNVFHGYLGDAPSPFVEFEGQQWYRTGDLVSMNEQGELTFRGRLKRFIKIGGEMVSLPAIESVLNNYPDTRTEDNEGPTIAVVATEADERPELVLFTTRPFEREIINRRLRNAGLSGLHNIRQVICIDLIPTLGSGKIDYRTLQSRLQGELVEA